MRPEPLYPAFAPVVSLPGIGSRLGKLLERVAGGRVVDLFWHLPAGLVDRRFAPPVAEAPDGRIVTITVQVLDHLPPRTARQPYRVIAGDHSGTLVLVFFHAREDWIQRTLPIGETRVISGRIERFQDQPQMAHPDHILPPAEATAIARVEPVYPLTAGLPPKTLAKAITAALERAPDLPEWLDPAFCRRQRWPAWRAALLAAHAPAAEADLAPTAPARARLAYDELLANQLALAVVRRRQRRLPGRTLRGDGRLQQQVIAALPYRLTGAQTIAMAEIAGDLASGKRMLRLLQGDVGSGKTIVALLTMLIAVEAGTQAALMAPTEVLVRQHFANLQPLAARAGVQVVLLTGRDKGRQRETVLAALAGGQAQILIGTHAAFQEDVQFHDLALVVIDEQHRFGVHQRLLLAGKGDKERGGVAILVMTATPIPRTLALTAYGDMEVSRLTEKPPGRRPVDTRAVPADRLGEVVARLSSRLAEGHQGFWICPLVENSEVVDLAAAELRHRELAAALPGVPIGLVHGRLKPAERDRAMADFVTGRTRLLVATTVVEVGVDVPAATVMVIEHAERFGLAQLHQLRGRIGRGDRPGTCLLLYTPPLGETAKARLAILRETEDGFRIAEEDLRLRGAGELLGTRQSGLPAFRVADLDHHAALLDIARDDAALALERDPELTSERGRALRLLLYLFERDAAVPLLRSG